MQGDRGAGAVAVSEIFFGQHLAHGGDPQQLDHLRQIQPRQPLAVATHLQATWGLEIQ